MAERSDAAWRSPDTFSIRTAVRLQRTHRPNQFKACRTAGGDDSRDSTHDDSV